MAEPPEALLAGVVSPEVMAPSLPLPVTAEGVDPAPVFAEGVAGRSLDSTPPLGAALSPDRTDPGVVAPLFVFSDPMPDEPLAPEPPVADVAPDPSAGCGVWDGVALPPPRVEPLFWPDELSP